MKVIGNGTIEKRGQNKWRIRIYCGTDKVTGEEIRPSKTIVGTKADARAALRAWIYEVNNGVKINADETTFKQYAAEWMKYRVQSGTLRKSTLRLDAQRVAKLELYIGGYTLADLDASTIKRAISRMRDDGISDDTLHKCIMKLGQIMRCAVDDDILMRNPCDKKSVKVPEPKPQHERISLTAPEAARLISILDAAGDADSRIIGVRLGIATGMRIGEVLGQTWADIDLDAGLLHITRQHTKEGDVQEPKTGAGVRTIAIDADTVTHLRAWRKVQQKTQVAQWLKRKEDMPIVSTSGGGFFSNDNYRHWFHRFCVLNGYGHWNDDEGNPIEPTRRNADGSRVGGNGHDADGRPYSRNNRRPRVTKHYSGLKFHELRHTHFTLIAPETDIKTIQTRGGWSSPLVPLKVYIHPDPENDRKAADLFGDLVRETPPAPDKVVGI